MSTSAPTARRSISPSLIIFLVMASAIIILLMLGQNPLNVLFIDPLINALMFLNIFTGGEFGLTIILFTILLRVATIPFTIRQLESTRAMQAAQPEMQEIQKKYKDPKRRQEEMMRLYREHGINPLGCFLPLVIQMAVFFGLYRALVFTVGGSPESLIGLSERMYHLPILQEQIPLKHEFLWLDLGQPDTTFILPILVGISTYVQQRLSITPNASPQQQQQQQMLTWMMPLMLMFITLNLPSGVGIYWVVSNIFSLFASYWVYGRRILSWRQLLPVPLEPETTPAATATTKKDKRADIEVPPDDYSIDASGDESQTDDAAPREGRSPDGRKRRGQRKKRR